MSVNVQCPRCKKLFDSILRECPACGCANEACTAKRVEMTFEIDESVVIPLRQAAKMLSRELDDVLTEAAEEWLDRFGHKHGLTRGERK